MRTWFSKKTQQVLISQRNHNTGFSIKRNFQYRFYLIDTWPKRILGCFELSKYVCNKAFQPIIDRIADQLPGWKAYLMTWAGRVVQVQHVLTAMLIYLAMAVDLPPWVLCSGKHTSVLHFMSVYGDAAPPHPYADF
jgi:hypothetical protein